MMLGKDGPRQNKSGKPTTVSRTNTISKVAKKDGSFTKVEPGDARAISNPKNSKEKEKKKNRSGSGS